MHDDGDTTLWMFVSLCSCMYISLTERFVEENVRLVSSADIVPTTIDVQCRHTRPIARWMPLLCYTDRRYDLSSSPFLGSKIFNGISDLYIPKLFFSFQNLIFENLVSWRQKETKLRASLIAVFFFKSNRWKFGRRSYGRRCSSFTRPTGLVRHRR